MTRTIQSTRSNLSRKDWPTLTDIRARLVSDAPNAGVLLVEIYYNYPQLLKLPVFSNSSFLGVRFSLIPDPIPVYVYTIMPISSAEPTQGP